MVESASLWTKGSSNGSTLGIRPGVNPGSAQTMSTTPSRAWSSSWGALPPSCIAQNGCTLSLPPDASPTFLAQGIRKVLDGFATGGMKVCILSVTSAAPAAPPRPASGSATAAATAAASPVFLIVRSPFGSV